MTIFSLIFKISTYIAIGTPGHGKDILDGLNTRDKLYLRGKILSYQKILPQLVNTLSCFVITLLNHLLVFQNNSKKFLTEYSRIAGKVGHSKTKNIIQYKL